MPDAPDMELVREFARDNSQAAFTELVRRHINLVYSVALRCIGNDGDAQDVTQAVFIIFARKAASLHEKIALTGWLYETTRFTAARLLRTNARRHAREQEAYMQSTLNESDTANVWTQLAPHLETAMGKLSERDRALLVLRFYENKTAQEAAALLGIGKDTAHKRAARAIEKLRNIFAKRGVTLSGAAIAGAVSANSIQAAPIGLSKIISAAAIAKGTATSASILTLTKGALKIMAWTKVKTAIVSAVVVGMATLSVIQHQAQVKLREQNKSLAQQLAQLQTDNKNLSRRVAQVKPALNLPAPQVQFVTPPTPSPTYNVPTNLYAWLKGNPKLTQEQVDAYLNKNGRTSANLLAAFRTSGDPALLQEAMQKYPNDPQVDFEAIFYGNLSPQEQRQWLNTFENSDPNNALANFLSALNYFNAGQIDQGVQEMTAASNKSFQDYTLDRMEDDEEAYLGAGYSQINADALALYSLALPQLAQLKQLGVDMVQLGQTYSQAGDQASAQSAFQMAANLGQSYAYPSPGEADISLLVGTIIEQNALQAMNPSAPYGNDGQTVQDVLNQLTQEKATLQQLGHQAEPLMPLLSNQDNVIYYNRFIMFGEENALQWLVNKYGQP
jgi:RNA polymerase sigma factor (sigma-70 family)